MSRLLFSKLVPGGNATILLHEPSIPLGSLPHIAKRLMDPLHIQAEQVGALYVANQSPPLLEMMGGEFCVNATRAAALILAGMGLLLPVNALCEPDSRGASGMEETGGSTSGGAHDGCAWEGSILVSGMPDPISVLACSDARTLALRLGTRSGRPEQTDRQPKKSAAKAVSIVQDWQEKLPSSMYCAARVDCSLVGVRGSEVDDGVCLVHMPGMTHILVDAEKHPAPPMEQRLWRQASAAWRKACGISRAPASGVVWHKREGKSHRIWPAVEVRASASEHMETACGSASLALALWECARSASASKAQALCPFPALDVIQPSGESLLVFLEFATGTLAPSSPSAAWIAGPVHLAAHGRAFV